MRRQTEKELRTGIQAASQDLKALSNLVLLNKASARVLQGQLIKTKSLYKRRLIEGNYIIKRTEEPIVEPQKHKTKTLIFQSKMNA